MSGRDGSDAGGHVPALYGVGHSSLGAATFCALLQRHGIRHLVDVRRFPVSRRWPQFNLGPLRDALAAAGIGYTHMPALGGRRDEPAPEGGENAGLEDAGLRSYADHARGDAFRRAFAELLVRARAEPTAMMCAEGDWRHCHRQIIADHALAAGMPVFHLTPGRAPEAAQANPLAVALPDGGVHYPPRQGGLF